MGAMHGAATLQSQEVSETNFNHIFYLTQSFQNTISTCNEYFKNISEMVCSPGFLPAFKAHEYFMLPVLSFQKLSHHRWLVTHAGCSAPGSGFREVLSPS